MADQSEDNQLFCGVGNIQNWLHIDQSDPEKWLDAHLANTELAGNGFDLLNICYMMILLKEKRSVDEIVEEYKTLMEKYNRPELLVGLGNVYYQDGQYFVSREMYMKALEENRGLEDCEMLYESLSWVMHKLSRDGLSF